MASFFGELPDAVLVAIFKRADALNLLRAVALTNRRLSALATDSEELWLNRLPPPLAAALRGAPGTSASATGLHLPTLYCSLYHANLLLNPWLCLDEQLAARRSAAGDAPGRAKPPWVSLGGGQPWQWGELAMEGLTLPSQAGVEPPRPPVPVPPFRPQGGPSWRPAGAVASSCGWGGHAWPALMQEVDLVEQLRLRGLSHAAACAFLDSCPALLLEVFTAGRFDCPGEFEARLVLDSQSGPVPAAHFELDAWMGGAAALASTGVRSAVPCEWRRQAVRLEGYPPGVRRALVLLRGTERRGWEGHYGAKFAAPALRFLPPGAVARG